MADSQSELEEKIRDRIDELKHASALASDQLHPEMGEWQQIQIDADIASMEREIEYLESLV